MALYVSARSSHTRIVIVRSVSCVMSIRIAYSAHLRATISARYVIYRNSGTRNQPPPANALANLHTPNSTTPASSVKSPGVLSASKLTPVMSVQKTISSSHYQLTVSVSANHRPL